ncbi:uncharacterized protein [Ptychodera flava]|uniref:uncharacterized protein n=1 Tax=Ptychodera flava TaxID=63121 RepID=UPI00396A7805
MNPYVNYEKKCDERNGITLKDISDAIQDIESSQRKLLGDELQCMRYCKRLLVRKPNEIWKDAVIAVRERFMTVVLSSGCGFYRFEVSIDHDGFPFSSEQVNSSRYETTIHHATDSARDDPTEQAQERRNRITTEERSGELQDVKYVDCNSLITAEQVLDVLIELLMSSSHHVIDETCLRYCLTLLKEKPLTVWENARISVYGENLLVVFKSGTEVNKFEITVNDKHEPLCVESIDDTNTVPKTHEDVVAFEHMDNQTSVDANKVSHVEDCKPAISFEHVHRVITSLGQRNPERPLDEDSRRILLFCNALIHQKDDLILKNARITVYGFDFAVVFKAGSEINEFEVTQNDKNEVICRERKLPGFWQPYPDSDVIHYNFGVKSIHTNHEVKPIEVKKDV